MLKQYPLPISVPFIIQFHITFKSKFKDLNEIISFVIIKRKRKLGSQNHQYTGHPKELTNF